MVESYTGGGAGGAILTDCVIENCLGVGAFSCTLEPIIAFLRQSGNQTVLCCVNRTGGPFRLTARHSLLSQNSYRDGGGFVVHPGGFGCFEV